MTFAAQIDANAAQAAEAAREALPSGDFPPLPRGPYQAVIVANKGVEPFTKDPTNPNYGKDVVRLQVQILDGSPLGAKRTEFVRIPLFSRFAPNPGAKTDEGKQFGSSARMFWNFFENVMGMATEDIIKGQLRSDVEGKYLTIILGAPKLPNQYNPLGFNDIDGVDAPHGNFDKTPTILPGGSAAPWLTPENTLIPNHPMLVARQQAAQGAGGYQPGGQAPATGGYVPGGGAHSGGYVPGGQVPVHQPQVAQQAAVQQQPSVPAGYSAGPNFPGHVVPQQGFAPGAPAAPQQGFGPGAAGPAQVNIPDGVPPEWSGQQSQGAGAGTGYGL